MSTEIKKEIPLEIAHVLFIEVVGYSKLLIDEQRALLDVLNKIVRGTDECRKADAAGRLIKIPTGDGMALVFYDSPEAPVECALEISRALKKHPELKLRMGCTQRPGQRHRRCERACECGRGRDQHGAAGHGLWRRRAHPALKACGG